MNDIDPQLLRRVIVENVEPQVDCGRFPIKRVVGETVAVKADVFADGHDAIAAVVLHRRAGDQAWSESRMRDSGSDRWEALFTVDALGRYEFTIVAWVDRFACWRRELSA